MKILARHRTRFRHQRRILSARIGLETHPARICLRFGESDLPGSLGQGPEWATEKLHGFLADFIHNHGVVPLDIWAMEAGSDPRIPGIIRFAHRLGMSTRLSVTGAGCGVEQIDEWLLSGVDRIEIWMAGLSQEVHGTVFDTDVEGICSFTSLVARRKKHFQTHAKLFVMIPWAGRANEELVAVLGWSKEVCVDGVEVVVPHRAEQVAPDLALLSSLRDSDASLTTMGNLKALKNMAGGNPGPGGERSGRGSCPMYGVRLELSVRGRLSSCPYHRPIAHRDGAVGLPTVDHYADIRGCDRECHHPLLRSGSALD